MVSVVTIFDGRFFRLTDGRLRGLQFDVVGDAVW
jgi:hypothetical protein